MNVFNHEYWVKLMAFSHAEAEAYRIRVTDPKPGVVRMEDLRNRGKEVVAEVVEEVVEEKVEIPEEKVIVKETRKKKGRPFTKK